MDASRTNRSLDTSLSGDGWLACSRTTPSLACSPNPTGSELRCSEPIRKKSQYLEISSMTPPTLPNRLLRNSQNFFVHGHGYGSRPAPCPAKKNSCSMHMQNCERNIQICI